MVSGCCVISVDILTTCVHFQQGVPTIKSVGVRKEKHLICSSLICWLEQLVIHVWININIYIYIYIQRAGRPRSRAPAPARPLRPLFLLYNNQTSLCLFTLSTVFYLLVKLTCSLLLFKIFNPSDR